MLIMNHVAKNYFEFSFGIGTASINSTIFFNVDVFVLISSQVFCLSFIYS